MTDTVVSGGCRETYSPAELGAAIREYVDEHEAPETTEDGEWYVSRPEVVEAIARQTNASESDIQARINDLVSDAELMEQTGDRLAT